jgi:Spy/CpxP family protein refolding chaperone
MQRSIPMARTARMALTALTVASAALMVLAPPAMAAPRNSVPNCGDFRAIARHLKLTPEQLTAAKALAASLRATVGPLQLSIDPLREDLADLLEAASPNACEAGAIVVQIDGIHDQIGAAREEYQEDFAALLTPAQLPRYQAILARCRPD